MKHSYKIRVSFSGLRENFPHLSNCFEDSVIGSFQIEESDCFKYIMFSSWVVRIIDHMEDIIIYED